MINFISFLCSNDISSREALVCPSMSSGKCGCLSGALDESLECALDQSKCTTFPDRKNFFANNFQNECGKTETNFCSVTVGNWALCSFFDEEEFQLDIRRNEVTFEDDSNNIWEPNAISKNFGSKTEIISSFEVEEKHCGKSITISRKISNRFHAMVKAKSIVNLKLMCEPKEKCSPMSMPQIIESGMTGLATYFYITNNKIFLL